MENTIKLEGTHEGWIINLRIDGIEVISPAIGELEIEQTYENAVTIIERSNAEAHERRNYTVKSMVDIRDALLTLGITGDSLFARIREDIERGLICEARRHLNFVDVIVNSNTVLRGDCPGKDA